MENPPSPGTEEEAMPLKGIGDPGESTEVTASNGSSNDYSNPKSGTPTMEPLKGIGDPGECKAVTVSNGSSNGYSNPRGATLTMFQTLLQFCKLKVPCWVVILILLVVIILMGIFATSESPRPAECPSPWIPLSGGCYNLSEEKMNWTASEDFCKKHGATLVVITNHTENDLKQLKPNDDCWIGLTRKNNTWKWVDGTDYEVADFSNDRRLNCAYWNSKIGALVCSTLRRFICSKTVGVVTS